MNWEYLVGDVREVLAGRPEGSVHTIVTSPPYWGLRDYGIPPSIWDGDTDCEHEWGEGLSGGEGHQGKKRWQHIAGDAKGKIRDSAPDAWTDVKQESYCVKCKAWLGCLGLEPTPEMFVEHLVGVCRELWRVLRDDGTFWLNLGDSYTQGGRGYGGKHTLPAGRGNDGWHSPPPGLKPKDLVMMPHRVALALQEDGWYVRSTIVWGKPNPMPESCTDRPTSAHEYIFLLTKKARYFYDADAVREPVKQCSIDRINQPNFNEQTGGPKDYGTAGINRNRSARKILEGFANNPTGRNLRNVWQIATQPYPEAHFATFPEKIPETCIKAGTSERGCCPLCGAPWERVVERTSHYEKRETAHQPNNTPTKVDSSGWKEPTINFKGFQPTCECVEEWKRRCGADKNGEYHGKAVKDYEGTGAENPSEVKARILAGMVPKVTTGFQPTCDCPPELEPVPCVVLDPFAGSGTTLKVARELGRSAIGIDISDEYRELATERAKLNVPDIESFA